ncbi:MAG: Phenylalanyl-tRNA synthetase, beta subunit, cytoplasmic [Vezdaea aestivalis]|nr:MAG: Phenylalanyl-tRNA synthetase, beta subunit, cytoplasmic [Vezdaea aestivalis]
MADDLTVRILAELENKDSLVSSEAFPNVPFLVIKSAIDRLQSRDMIENSAIERDEVHLTAEAKKIASEGSHEAKVFEAVRQAINGLKITELPNKVGKESAKIGQGKAFKDGWIQKTKEGTLVTKVDSIKDITREHLQVIEKTKSHPDTKTLVDLKKRKLITVQKVISYKLSKGPKYAKEIVKAETDLTSDMLSNDSWKTLTFKPYNFKALGGAQSSGALHPLNKVRHEFRQIFFEMGFDEMPTNRYVETGFWNFDALFVPQQHPARDLQDTFYILDPPTAGRPQPDPASESKLDYKQYFRNIQQVHQNGKYGSIGYRYPWNEAEAMRLVLRTHTTAVSTYMLHKLALDPKPARYFSIDRVFRNETVDATHLAEFHQVEGVIADFGLALGGLIGFMETFFSKMGVNGLRFKPAYNPYTEPSLEIFGWHEGLKKWVEIGNSGMFRPEMLEPMGLPKDMRVYGWGLSLERPTMIKYGVSNIRELLGHKVDLSFVEQNSAVRLEKD